MRSGGREAIEEVLGAARPLAQVLWTRETEAGAFDTPERRAALEARLGEVTNGIGDESVRKYYRQEFGERLRQLFSPIDVTTRRRDWDERRGGGRIRDVPGGSQECVPRRSAGPAPDRRAPHSGAASPTWRRARSLPGARCIAATASPFRGARR